MARIRDKRGDFVLVITNQGFTNSEKGSKEQVCLGKIVPANIEHMAYVQSIVDAKVRAVREGSAVPWILASALLIHTNCTTGTGAIVLGKPAICVMSLDNVVCRHYLSNDRDAVVRRLQKIAKALGIDLTPEVDYCVRKVLLISIHRMAPFVRFRRLLAGAFYDFRTGT